MLTKGRENDSLCEVLERHGTSDVGEGECAPGQSSWCGGLYSDAPKTLLTDHARVGTSWRSTNAVFPPGTVLHFSRTLSVDKGFMTALGGLIKGI